MDGRRERRKGGGGFQKEECSEAKFMKVQFSLRILGIILIFLLRLEVSVYNVYTTKQFQTTFALL
jgi:hypothetical protein